MHTKSVLYPNFCCRRSSFCLCVSVVSPVCPQEKICSVSFIRVLVGEYNRRDAQGDCKKIYIRSKENLPDFAAIADNVGTDGNAVGTGGIGIGSNFSSSAIRLKEVSRNDNEFIFRIYTSRTFQQCGTLGWRSVSVSVGTINVFSSQIR